MQIHPVGNAGPARRRAAPLTPAARLSCADGPRAQSHPDSLLSSWRCGPRAPVPVSAGAAKELAGTARRRYAVRTGTHGRRN